MFCLRAVGGEAPGGDFFSSRGKKDFLSAGKKRGAMWPLVLLSPRRTLSRWSDLDSAWRLGCAFYPREKKGIFFQLEKIREAVWPLALLSPRRTLSRWSDLDSAWRLGCAFFPREKKGIFFQLEKIREAVGHLRCSVLGEPCWSDLDSAWRLGCAFFPRKGDLGASGRSPPRPPAPSDSGGVFSSRVNKHRGTALQANQVGGSGGGVARGWCHGRHGQARTNAPC
jgi:hypothetical protein